MKTATGILVISFFLTAGCSPFKMTNSWKEKDIQPQPYKKILVLSLMNDFHNRSVRENMESNLAAGLRKLGYSAVCACDEFNPKTFEGLSEKEALSKIANSGIDAVLTVVLLDKSRERYYVPAQVHYSPYVIYHSRFYGYYRTMYIRVYSPGYYSLNDKYFWESNFYTIDSTTQLLYSAQSESFDPVTSSLSYQYSDMILKDMLRSKVIKKNQP